MTLICHCDDHGPVTKPSFTQVSRRFSWSVSVSKEKCACPDQSFAIVLAASRLPRSPVVCMVHGKLSTDARQLQVRCRPEKETVCLLKHDGFHFEGKHSPFLVCILHLPA